MRSLAVAQLGGLLLGVFFCPALACSALGDEPAELLKVSTKRPTDQVQVTRRDKQLVLEVRSPTGIGEATLERVAERWPDVVVLRLHLKGLASLRIEQKQLALNLAVSSTAPHTVRRWRDAREDDELKKDSPLWTGVEWHEADGVFEVRLPRAFFDGNPPTVRLKWIDFYR